MWYLNPTLSQASRKHLTYFSSQPRRKVIFRAAAAKSQIYFLTSTQYLSWVQTLVCRLEGLNWLFVKVMFHLIKLNQKTFQTLTQIVLFWESKALHLHLKLNESILNSMFFPFPVIKTDCHLVGEVFEDFSLQQIVLSNTCHPRIN